MPIVEKLENIDNKREKKQEKSVTISSSRKHFVVNLFLF